MFYGIHTRMRDASTLNIKSKKSWFAYSILWLGLFFTLFVVYYTNKNIELQENKDFAYICNEIKTKVIAQLHSHAQLLRNCASFLSASDTVTRSEWKTFIDKSKTSENLPGFQGIGYSVIIPKHFLQHHINCIRKEGFQDYNIRPIGDREIYTSIIFLEPFQGRNLKALGFDPFSESIRRTCMIQARDLDRTSLTKKVYLVQDDGFEKKAGIIMNTPVYRKGKPTNSIEERRTAIIGWVFSANRMDDFLKGVLGNWGSNDKNGIQLRVYDGDSISDNTLLLDTRQQSLLKEEQSDRSIVIPLVFNDNRWTLLFTKTKEPFLHIQGKVFIVSISGFIISLLLFALSLSLLNTRFRAQQIAERLTRDLTEKNQEYEALNEELTRTIEERYIAKVRAEDNEIKYKILFEQSAIPIWEEDFSEVKEYFDGLKAKGITDFRSHFEFHQEEIYDLIELIKVVDINQTSVTFFKVEKKEDVFSNIHNYFNDASIEIFKEEIIALAEGKTYFECEIPIKEVHGEYKYLNLYLQVCSGYEQSLSKVLVSFIDITARKEAEQKLQKQNKEYEALNEELRQTNEELYIAKQKTEESEIKYKMAFKTSPDAVNINKLDGTYIDINEGFTALTGYTNEDVIGKSSLEINIWTIPEDRDKLLKGLREDGKVENLESVFLCKDGTTKTSLMSAALIKINSEPHILSITRNISDRKVIENELKAAKDKAEESDRLKSSFLQNMSHEVRTPLNAIVGFSELMVKPNQAPEKLKKYSETISESSNKLIEIITDVIEISQIQSNLVSVNISQFDLITLIRRIEENYSVKAKEKGIELLFKSNIAQKEFPILSDRDKIEKILSHIIDNAIKFTSKGLVEVACKVENQTLIYSISDTGIGIPAEMQSIIFEPFMQVETGIQRNYGGNGLGLAIANAYAELLHGTISLESELNRGTTVTISIPAKSINKLKEEELISEKKRMSRTVLIAEDEYSNYLYISELLEGENLNILHVENGQQAVDLCKINKEIGLILMDIKMPIMDGYKAARLIKEFSPEIIIIAQTAYALNSEKEKFAGVFDDYLSKPIGVGELSERLKKYLNIF